MLQPGRKYSATDSYRYGFNGKENDNEVKGEGNQQDYGMRIYDPRVGRFLSVDPLTKGYPMLTPYQYASNSPISGIDLDGGEFKYYALEWKDKSYTKLKLGNLVSTNDNITINFSFAIGPTGFTIPITLDRSLFGLNGTFVNYFGSLVKIPEGYDLNKLPSQDDPVWESFETDQEIDDDFVGAVRQIVFAIQNVAFLRDIVKNGKLSDYLRNKNVIERAHQLKASRQKAVKDAWAQEKELIEKTGRGTRDWTKKELAELKRNGKVKGYEGHHINNVANHSELASNPNNVEFVRGRKEHLKKHDGNFRNPSSGQMIDRKKLIDERLNNKPGG